MSSWKMKMRGNKERKRSVDSTVESSALKRLKTMPHQNDAANLVVRVGAVCFHLRLLPLLKESFYLMKLVDTRWTSLVEREGLPLIVHMPKNSHCTPEVFKIIIHYCYHQMDKPELSCDILIQLIVACEFLEMERLKRFARKALDACLQTWEECLRILSTFDSNLLPKKGGNLVNDDKSANEDVASLGENDDEDSFFDFQFEQLFETCETAFLQKIGAFTYLSMDRFTSPSCNLACLVQVAERLPVHTAKIIFGSLLLERFGLCCMGENGPLNLICHNPTPSLHKSGVNVRYYVEGNASLSHGPNPRLALYNSGDSVGHLIYPTGTSYGHREIAIQALQEILRTDLKDIRRRSLLVLYLAKLVRPEKDGVGNMTDICLDFLCLLLAEAAELLATFPDQALVECLEVEIRFLELFVAKFFRVGFTAQIPTFPKAIVSGDHNIQSLLARFNFPTLLSIVKYCGILHDEKRPNLAKEGHSHQALSKGTFGGLPGGEGLSGVARILDCCLLKHLNENSFTAEQVSEIYKEFPNQWRTSNTGNNCVLEDRLTREVSSLEHMHKLSKTINSEILSDEVVESLSQQFGLGCDWNGPLLQERGVKIHRKTQEKTKIQDTLLKMQGTTLKTQQCDILGLRKEACEDLLRKLRKKACEVRNLQEDMKQVKRKLKDLESTLKKERGKLEEKTSKIETLVQDVMQVEGTLKELECKIQQERRERSGKASEVETLLQDKKQLAGKHEDLVSMLEMKRFEVKEKSGEVATIVQDKKRMEGKLANLERKIGKEKEKAACRMCRVRKRDSLLLPCRHFHFCSECIRAHQRQGKTKTCPTCKVSTSSVLKCIV